MISFIRFPLTGGWALWITDHFAIHYGPHMRPRIAARFYGRQDR